MSLPLAWVTCCLEESATLCLHSLQVNCTTCSDCKVSSCLVMAPADFDILCMQDAIFCSGGPQSDALILHVIVQTLTKLHPYKRIIRYPIHPPEWNQQRWTGSWKGSAGTEMGRKGKDGKGLTGYKGISSSNANILYQCKSYFATIIFLHHQNVSFQRGCCD